MVNRQAAPPPKLCPQITSLYSGNFAKTPFTTSPQTSHVLSVISAIPLWALPPQKSRVTKKTNDDVSER